MIFYDMILKYDDEIIHEIPIDIKIKIGKLKKIHYNNAVNFLDDIWKLTKSTCSSYLNTNWIKNLGIGKHKLLNDIKFYSILTIYLSIKNRTLKGNSIKDFAEDYYNKETDGEKDKENLITSFENLSCSWLDYMFDIKNIIDDSNFHYCFYEDIENIETYDDRSIHMYPSIFYNIIVNWDKCPYNEMYSQGMTFEQVDKFYKEFNNLINDSNESDRLDKIIKSYIIEKFFNISFLYDLSNYTEEKFEKNIGLTDKHIKNTSTLDIPNKLFPLNGYDQKQSFYSEFECKEAQRLLTLSEIVSIPMPFYRNNYIKLIDDEYGKNFTDIFWHSKLREKFFYLNSYLIPLLLKVYYYLIYLYTKNLDKNQNYNIYNILRSYIEKNLDKYEKFDLSEKHNFKNNFTKEKKEAFEINATQIIYNYVYEKDILNEDTNLKYISNTIEENSKGSSNIDNLPGFISDIHDSYELNFPFNARYEAYKNNHRKM